MAPFLMALRISGIKLIAVWLGLCGSASADSLAWSASLAASARHFESQEMNVGGKRIVDEYGLLPGLEGGLAAAMGPACLSVYTQYHEGTVAYDGQTQFGHPIRSSTRERMATVGLAGKYAVAATIDIMAAIEHQKASREIQGVGAVAGLTERIATTRAIIGVAKRIGFGGTGTHGPNGATLHAGAAVMLGLPEHLKVNFPQFFDAVSLSTRHPVGVRLSALLTPIALPWYLSLSVDRTRVARSNMAMLTSMGVHAGSLVQPAHRVTAVTLSAGYRF